MKNKDISSEMPMKSLMRLRCVWTYIGIKYSIIYVVPKVELAFYSGRNERDIGEARDQDGMG